MVKIMNMYNKRYLHKSISKCKENGSNNKDNNTAREASLNEPEISDISSA